MAGRVARLGAWALLAAMACSTVAGLVAWHEGYRVYAVKTGSMTPGLPPGDLVVDSPPDGAYDKGQVLTFESGATGPSAEPVTTHRVLKVKADELVTKGDANRTPDVHRPALSDVVGEVVGQVPNGGYVLVYLSRWDGLASLVLALLTVWLSAELFLREERPATA
jgi:signal peptidase I